jgi:hypothetical protein
VAEGCASAQYFVQQALNCFLDALITGQCKTPSIGCLMSACGSQFAACLSDRCPPPPTDGG